MTTERKCNGTNRRGEPCGRTPAPGHLVCINHGARSPQAMAAANRRLQRAAAEVAVATYGLSIEIGPEAALLAEVQRTAGHVAWLSEKVRDLDESELVWGVAEQTVTTGGGGGEDGDDEGGGSTQTKYKAAKSVWLQLYQDERAHLARVSRDAITAGATERLVSTFERIGAQMVSAFDRTIASSGLSPEQQEQMLAAFVVELEAFPATDDRT
jgi:hypothetical protein